MSRRRLPPSPYEREWSIPAPDPERYGRLSHHYALPLIAICLGAWCVLACAVVLVLDVIEALS